MAEAEGGSEQDDVSFLRTVSQFKNSIYAVGERTIMFRLLPVIRINHRRGLSSFSRGFHQIITCQQIFNRDIHLVDGRDLIF